MLKINWVNFEKLLNESVEILKSERKENGHYYKCLVNGTLKEFLVSNY